MSLRQPGCWSSRSAEKWTADEGRSRSADKGKPLAIGTRRETAHRLRPRAAARSSKLILINFDQKRMGEAGGSSPPVVPVSLRFTMMTFYLSQKTPLQ